MCFVQTQAELREGRYCSSIEHSTLLKKTYSATEKECLAAVYGMLICRPYLLGEKFDICNDHAYLRWLLEITEHSERLMQWRMRLAEFDFEIQHKKGSLNTQADAISRLSTQVRTTEHEETEILCLSVSNLYPGTRKEDDVTEEQE
eukprot:IDg18187t1